MSQRLHSALRVRQNGALVIVQPWDGARVAGDSLTVDLTTGALKLTDYARLESNYFDAFGVAGLVPLLGSYALVLVTAGTQVWCRKHHLRLRCRPPVSSCPWTGW